MPDTEPINLDVTRESKVRTNLWLFIIAIVGAVSTYAIWRDMTEHNRDRIAENNQQERHFEATDARVLELEKRAVALERKIDKMDGNLEYLIKLQEREERRNFSKQ
jgi:hypothetical protein